MASVGLGSGTVAAAAVAPAAAGRRRPRRSVLAVRPAATRGGPAAAAKEEKSIGDFIFGLIFRDNQLVETDPLLNKVDNGAPAPRSAIPRSTVSGTKIRGGTTAGKKASDDSGGGFNLGGLFAKKD